MSVSAGKVLVKSENGKGTLKHRDITAQPFILTALPLKRPQEEHNDIDLPVGQVDSYCCPALQQLKLTGAALFC